MSINCKTILILKDPETNPMTIVDFVVKGLNNFVISQNKKIPEVFKQEHPEQYKEIINFKLEVDYENVINNNQHGFIYFAFYNDKTNDLEQRKMYFGWGDHLNEENKDMDCTHNKKMMSLSVGSSGMCKEFFQEVFLETNKFADPYTDVNDSDSVDYEDFETFFRKYGSPYLLLRDL